MTKAELEDEVALLKQRLDDAGEKLRGRLGELDEARADLATAEEVAERAEDEAVEPMREAYTWLCLLGEHLDRMRAGLVRRAQAGKTLPGWERWEERARECLDGAMGALAV